MRNTLILLILVLISSCIDDYNLKLKSNDPKLVVQGVITNKVGPYLILLTKSRLNLTFHPYEDYNKNSNLTMDGGVEPIQDAEVYLTDIEESITDTLVKAWLPNNVKKWQIAVNYQLGDPNGYYMTQKSKGVPGHTYSLQIKWQNEEYHAKSYMPLVPPLDSVQFNFTKGAIGKEDYNIPLLFFKEPQNELNYYLFITPGNSRVWPYSILSDEYLKDYVNGLDVCKGIAPDYWMNAYPYVYDGKLDSDYFIEMHSLTKEAYEYYKALIQQFRTDGGGYSPSPASPPTNLDNGALGFFRASAVSRVEFKQDNGN